MIKRIIAVMVSIIASLIFVLIKLPSDMSKAEEKTNAVETATESVKVFFDVPLDQNLQEYIFELCRIYNVSPTLVFAVIEQESDYNPNALNGSENCYGLMQIHECNFSAYGLDEPYNAYENARVGITMLSELLNKYKDVSKALMAYNCGEYGARQLWNRGVTSTSYSRSVLNIQEKISQKERVYYVEES